MNKDANNEDLPNLEGFDKLIHEPARLLIMANLYLVKRAESLFLKNQIGLTWGNLGSHIAKLEEAKYIVVEKHFKNKKPFTMLSLTEKGKRAFEEYRKLMKGII